MTKKIADVCFQSQDGYHTENITGIPHITCNHCSFAATSEAKIISHIWEAHDVCHQCYLCHAGLKSWKELLDHVRRRHLPANSKLFICKECDTTKSNFELFVLHHMKHFQRTKRTRKKSDAKNATRGENPSDILRKSGKKSLIITEPSMTEGACEGATSSKTLFRCHICSYTTKSGCSLDSHIRRHLNVREFACDICSRAFVSKGELNRHKNCRHPNASSTKHQCPHCWFYAWRKDVIAKHIETHHPEVVLKKTRPRGQNPKVARVENFHYAAPLEASSGGSVLRAILTSDSL